MQVLTSLLRTGSVEESELREAGLCEEMELQHLNEGTQLEVKQLVNVRRQRKFFCY